MDVLQLSHAGSVRTLCRLIQGADKPIVVSDGSHERMVVMPPPVFERVLLRDGREECRCNGVFGGGCSPDVLLEDVSGRDDASYLPA